MYGILFIINILFILEAPVFSTKCLSESQKQGCENVFNSHAMKKSCCKQMDQFVEKINVCQTRCKTDEFTCQVSNCVTQQEYGIVTNDKIDEEKVKKELNKLNMEDPSSKPLNDQLRRNCLHGQYLKYVTSGARCDTMQFQVCAFVNYLMGCQKFNSSPSRCENLSRSVNVCKPVLQQYLQQQSRSYDT